MMHSINHTFDWDSQLRFANLSCDNNPMHVDIVAARRTHPGAPIVHGIHSLVWLLDSFVQSALFVPGAKTLKAQFLQPIYIGDRVTLEFSQSPARGVRARALVGSEEVLAASIGFDEIEQPIVLPPGRSHRARIPPPDSPMEIDLEDMDGLAGSLLFGPASSSVDSLFPFAVRAFGAHRIATLLCASCLVGMVVPGLHSTFSGLDVVLRADDADPLDSVLFSVLSVTKRFRLVRIGIHGPGVRGSLETVSRKPPVKQPDMQRLISLVARDEFRGSSALIVGGSRGIGELTAKLIAAGGGEVVITYAIGKDDADAVISQIQSAGMKCTGMAYDVCRPAEGQLASLNMIPTHLYYFATPRIFRRKFGLFDLGRFSEFNTFYVTAFFDLVQSCLRLTSTGIRVFYPSTSAIDARPATMTEYTMSKAAGEVLCADLAKYVPGAHVVSRRLPRLPTDQTSSVVQSDTTDPVETILPILREMHRQ